jgi:hypothetical protein
VIIIAARWYQGDASHLAIAEELAGNVINLEGDDLVSVPLGLTDTASTTCLPWNNFRTTDFTPS